MTRRRHLRTRRAVAALLWIPVLLLSIGAAVILAVSPDPAALAVGLILGAFFAWVADISVYLARLERRGVTVDEIPAAPPECPECGAAMRLVGGAWSPLIDGDLLQYRCAGAGGHGYIQRATPVRVEVHLDRWPEGDRRRAWPLLPSGVA